MLWNGFNSFLTGNADKWSLRFKILFSETFRNHRKRTNQTIEEHDAHPRPWKWLRMFLFLSILGLISFLNTLLVGAFAFPWMALLIASIVPITIAVFLYECILHEKIRLTDVVLIFMVGTTISFLATGFLNIDLGDKGLNTVIIAPIIEEIAKAIPIILAIKIMKIKRVSSAIFVGWIVGSGFQIAETLGYSTYYGYMGIFSQIQILPSGTQYIFTGTLDYSMMFLRLLFSFGMHTFWGALEGGAFMFSQKKDNSKFNYGRFTIWFVFCVLLHMTWNTINYYVYISSPIWSIVLSVLMQLMYLPLFFYIVDAGIRDDKEFVAKSMLEKPIDDGLKN